MISTVKVARPIKLSNCLGLTTSFWIVSERLRSSLFYQHSSKNHFPKKLHLR
ncbi:unnamed protein product, partial [Nesidiocoris tenuis]